MNRKCIQILRANKDYNLLASNEILLDGQPLYNKSNNRMYIGDGVSQLKNLKPITTQIILLDNNGTNVGKLTAEELSVIEQTYLINVLDKMYIFNSISVIDNLEKYVYVYIDYETGTATHKLIIDKSSGDWYIANINNITIIDDLIEGN